MADNTLLNLAKQGKPGAIAALLNQSFQKEGWSCKASSNGNELKLIFEGETPPKLDQLRDRLLRGLQKVDPSGVEILLVESRQTGHHKSLWQEYFYLTSGSTIENYSPELSAIAGSQSLSAASISVDSENLIYDPEFAIKIAQKLHKKAQSIVLGYIVLGGFVGFILVGGIFGGSRFIEFLIVGGIGGLFGVAIGQSIGTSYSLSIEGQSQILYAQIQTEINTRLSLRK